MARKKCSIEEIENDIAVFQRYSSEIPENLQREKAQILQESYVENLPQIIEDQLIFLFNNVTKRMDFEVIYLPETGLKVRQIDIKKKIVGNPFEGNKKYIFIEAFKLYRKMIVDDYDKIELLKYYGYCTKNQTRKLVTRLTRQMYYASAQYASRSPLNNGNFSGILVRKKHLIMQESTDTHDVYVEYYVKKMEYTLDDMYKLFVRVMARIHGQGQNVNVTIVDQLYEDYLRDDETCLQDALVNNERKFIKKKYKS